MHVLKAAENGLYPVHANMRAIVREDIGRLGSTVREISISQATDT
jgi:hypothetical protein